METYKHIVQYYETDKMGITHHSNYIRWMEEARVDFLKQIGWDYAKLEEQGIVSPVVEINCRYKAPTTFEDEISILVFVDEIQGIKLKIKYIMMNAQGNVVAEADSVHGFFNSEGKPVRLSTQLPDFYNALVTIAAE